KRWTTEGADMSKVIIDEGLRARLNNLNEQHELCDPAGNTLGRYLPEDMYREMLLACADAQITQEELQRRRQEPRGRTLAEIWKTPGQSWAISGRTVRRFVIRVSTFFPHSSLVIRPSPPASFIHPCRLLYSLLASPETSPPAHRAGALSRAMHFQFEVTP